MHDGPVKTVARSPFNKDLLLTLGGWNLCLWHVEVDEPLLVSRSHDAQLTAGHWSPARPAVFFVAKSDGTVDVWDLLDRTSDPVLTQPVTPHSITRVVPHRVSSQQQLLAIGDSYGTLHVLEVPWVFRTPVSRELAALNTYVEREQARIAYMGGRREGRAAQRRALEQEEKRVAQEAADRARPAEDEERVTMLRQFQEFLVLEDKLQLELGLKEEVRRLPSLPHTHTCVCDSLCDAAAV